VGSRFRVVVGEQHPFGGDLIEIRRSSRHHASVVGADVSDADVVTHVTQDDQQGH
jgi:hypothetical protein